MAENLVKALDAAQGVPGAPVAPGAVYQRRLGIFYAILGATTFSGKGIIVKLGYQYGADAVDLLMLRMLFALPLFLAMAWWAGRSKPPLTLRDWGSLVGLGFTGFYLASALDFAGLAYITASLERLILCMQPTLVLLLGWIIFKRKVHSKHILGIVVTYAGVLCVFGFEAAKGGNQSVGLGGALVLLSTLSYSTYLIWSGGMVKRLGSPRLVGLATSFACLFAIAQYLILRPMESIFHVAPQIIWLSMINATLCTMVPVLTVMLAIARVGPAVASQVGMIGPLVTILLGIWILDEQFTMSLAIGSIFVIGGIFIFTRAESVK